MAIGAVEDQENAQSEIPDVDTGNIPSGAGGSMSSPTQASQDGVHPSVAKHDNVFTVQNGN